jgi:hypothetical protein
MKTVGSTFTASRTGIPGPRPYSPSPTRAPASPNCVRTGASTWWLPVLVTTPAEWAGDTSIATADPVSSLNLPPKRTTIGISGNKPTYLSRLRGIAINARAPTSSNSVRRKRHVSPTCGLRTNRRRASAGGRHPMPPPSASAEHCGPPRWRTNTEPISPAISRLLVAAKPARKAAPVHMLPPPTGPIVR